MKRGAHVFRRPPAGTAAKMQRMKDIIRARLEEEAEARQAAARAEASGNGSAEPEAPEPAEAPAPAEPVEEVPSEEQVAEMQAEVETLQKKKHLLFVKLKEILREEERAKAEAEELKRAAQAREQAQQADEQRRLDRCAPSRHRIPALSRPAPRPVLPLTHFRPPRSRAGRPSR